MKYGTRKKHVIFIILLILIPVAAGLIASYFIESEKIVPKIEVSLSENQKILPVLYYEQHSGFWKIGTHTFLPSGDETTEIEEHLRSFSRTYPLSALRNLSAKNPSVKSLGRPMVYYNSPDGEIFLFEHYDSDEFTLIRNDIRVKIPREHYESYHEFLYFGENYYLFTLLHTDEDILRVYRLSKDFETEKTFDIAYKRLGIPGHALIEDSFASVGDNLFIALDGKILKYNMENDESEFIIPDYSLLGIIADGECFHAVGMEENGEYAFEAFDSEGKSLSKTEKALPFGFGYSPYTFSTNETLYMYGSEIFFRFAYDEKCYILSFDMESEEWTNCWIAEKEDLPHNPGNVKFIIFENGNYYDLFPFWNNLQ